MKVEYRKYTLRFKFDAGTSRGVLRTKDSWFVRIENTDRNGIGECGILKGLSIEDYDSFEDNIKKNINVYINDYQSYNVSKLSKYPAIRFGFEMANMDFGLSNSGLLFENDFTRGKDSIPINGLVWMGDYRFMHDQIRQKIKDGYKCIKLKIGSIDFQEEIRLLSYIRSEFTQIDLNIRVDANGAFTLATALEKLKRLSEFDIHSIEQPIKPKHWQEMADLCYRSPLDIALDEELIGIHEDEEQNHLLSTIGPQYIVLKPSLLGGFEATENWMNHAKLNNVGFWITSALESNIGLNAIAQWTYEQDLEMDQGLGTGQLYSNNFEGPLYIANGHLHFNPEIPVYKNFDLF